MNLSKLSAFLCLCLLFTIFRRITGKIHNLSYTDDSRRNILLSKFVYGNNGTLDFAMSNFTVPEAVLKKSSTEGDSNSLGSIGFTLSRGTQISRGIGVNPHVCQLEQHDQEIDALFFVFNFASRKLIVNRSAASQRIKLCADTTESASCPYSEIGETRNATKKTGSFFEHFFGTGGYDGMPYFNYIPLSLLDGQYSAKFGIRFNLDQSGLYFLYYHNCFNYREHGFSDRVAVHISVNIVERNVGSFLSFGDIPRPTLYICMAFLFALAMILWANLLCRSDSRLVFKIHRIMLLLVLLKSLSLFFHGINYYFVSLYGHQRELWAVIYYVTHLLKGALLFGVIILIGTGYTFFKNFLTDRDRRLFMFILPIQILDNIAMIIFEESEFSDYRYLFWFQIFVFLDIVCCVAIILPVLWSIKHLKEAARIDGKMAFNLEKLQLFRQFYLLVILYVYATRIAKFIIEFLLPEQDFWISEAIVELSTLLFFCLVGVKFRPLKSNPYLKLTLDDAEDDAESGVALTANGLFENVSRVQKTMVTVNEGEDSFSAKTGRRDIGLLTL